MKLREVIKKEGDVIILYSSDKSKVLGRFEFGEGKKYKDEDAARAAAHKREGQVQFFKHREAERKPLAVLLVEKLHHTAAWHRCWEKVKGNYDDRAAAAICTWSVQRPPNPPDVYKGTRAKGSAVPANSLHPLTEAMIALSLDDAYALDEVLAAEMELRGISELHIDTDTWTITEITGAGVAQNPTESVPAYSPEFEATRTALAKAGLLEAGARHTRREYQIIEGTIRLMAELHGELESLDTLLAATQEAANANVADYLESKIHQSFTAQADQMLAEGVIERDERIELSHAIGLALDAFAAEVNAKLPGLHSHSLDLKYAEFVSPTVLMAAREAASGTGWRPGLDGKFLHEQVSCVEAGISIDKDGNLSGRVVVGGMSSNGNDYLEAALHTVGGVFAGKPVYVDHPTRTEETDRPERSVRDLVGKLPESLADFYVDTIKEGPFAGRKATFFRNGKLSATAGWLGTLIKEKIAGDMSINAIGAGQGGPNHTFAVEAFTDATSLDFVTRAGAGGKGVLESAGRPAADIHRVLLETLTVAEVAEVAPHIVNEIATRERQKAYGEKKELTESKEALSMAQSKLNGTQIALAEAIGRLRTYRMTEQTSKGQGVVEAELSAAKLPESATTHVRRLMEAHVHQFAVEATNAEPVLPTGSGLKPGDPPTIELPPDVAELPADGQQLWLGGYMENIAKGEEQAIHIAWAKVYSDGWIKGDQGWKKETPIPAPGEALPIPMTAAELKKRTGDVIKEVRALFAQQTNAGQPVGVGASAAQVAGGRTTESGEPDKEQAALTEAFKGLLPDGEAKVAAMGRA